ncbi:hypothetical protein FB451DRAFT_1196858 [Mycena latifolia]|nr:hypothetical protein FB451DRAFT_1196858 [Mycena latifolia]
MQRRSASSSKIRILGSQRPSYNCVGLVRVEEQILRRQVIDDYRRMGKRSLRHRLQSMCFSDEFWSVANQFSSDMEEEHRETLEHLQGLAEDDDFDPNNIPAAPTLVNMDRVLDGSERIELSHVGGEFGAWEDDIEEAEDASETRRTREEDWRTRCDHMEVRNIVFRGQMLDMVHAYVQYCAQQELPVRQGREGPALDSVEEIYSIQVVDMFDFRSVNVKLDPHGNGVASALIMEGLMPCAPWSLNVAIRICALQALSLPTIFNCV